LMAERILKRFGSGLPTVFPSDDRRAPVVA
jgi:hypothetical protein